jgi:hypothetical protein
MLDLDNFAISQTMTSGDAPGWIHKHCAVLSDDATSILIRKGKVGRSKGSSFVENIDDWRLHLADWRWERLTDRKWPQLEIRRKDGKRNHLWKIRVALWDRELGWIEELKEKMGELAKDLGVQPDLDCVAKLYLPPVHHEPLPKVEDEYGVFRIKVDGVIVRYVEESWSIQMTVEGSLPQETIDLLTTDLVEKLIALENTLHEVKPL